MSKEIAHEVCIFKEDGTVFTRGPFHNKAVAFFYIKANLKEFKGLRDYVIRPVKEVELKLSLDIVAHFIVWVLNSRMHRLISFQGDKKVDCIKNELIPQFMHAYPTGIINAIKTY